jgi:hypothetical protein
MRNEIVHSEFEFYRAHQDEFVAKYNGKVIALHNHEVVGAFQSYEEAYDEIVPKYAMGTFILQLCTPGAEAYTVRAHTRYTFH